jgi:hypothetical protein
MLHHSQQTILRVLHPANQLHVACWTPTVEESTSPQRHFGVTRNACQRAAAGGEWQTLRGGPGSRHISSTPGEGTMVPCCCRCCWAEA